MAQNLPHPPYGMRDTARGMGGEMADVGLDRYGRIRNAGRLSRPKRRIAGHGAVLAALDT